MLSLEQAKAETGSALAKKNLLVLVGVCRVEYWGRAASKLPKGKRLLLIKEDGSFAVHQNRLLRPTNYMMNAKIGLEIADNSLVISAKKIRPKEEIKAFFDSVEFAKQFEMRENSDLRLFGSEKQLSDELMQGLDFIEPGLKPLKQEQVFRKGIADIIAEDASGRMVVIEVKRRLADYAAVSQLQRYMKQVEKTLGKETRGILVAPDIRKNALEMLERYGLEFCRFEFEIGNPKATIKGVQKKQQTIFEALDAKKESFKP